MTFVQARWFHSGRLKPIRLIVIHCTVSPEMGTGAEAVANYFATTSTKGSAHRVADNDSVVECVHDGDTAFGAAGANSDGLHLELVGQPTQTRDEWLDAYSTHELAIGQSVVEEWSVNHDIPLRWLTIAEVADGVTKGVTTHADVSAAFPAVSTGHWDPGPNFPRDVFPVAAPHPPPPPEDDTVIYTYVQKPGDTAVYVARHGEPAVHVGDASFGFKDAEAMVRYQGDKLVPSADGVDVPDAQGETRKVLLLSSVESQKWFGI